MFVANFVLIILVSEDKWFRRATLIRLYSPWMAFWMLDAPRHHAPKCCLNSDLGQTQTFCVKNTRNIQWICHLTHSSESETVTYLNNKWGYPKTPGIPEGFDAFSPVSSYIRSVLFIVLRWTDCQNTYGARAFVEFWHSHH